MHATEGNLSELCERVKEKIENFLKDFLGIFFTDPRTHRDCGKRMRKSVFVACALRQSARACVNTVRLSGRDLCTFELLFF